MTETPSTPPLHEDLGSFGLLAVIAVLATNWRRLIIGPALATAVAFLVASLIAPTFTARASFMPPQAQGGAASALSSVAALTGLSTGMPKTPSDQYVAFMQSRTISDRMIERFGLVKAYDVDLLSDARLLLSQNVRFNVGRKDGLVSIEVDDHDPKRAADMANVYIEELGRMTSQLAITEAQQRRVFFEAQLQQTRDRLAKAQVALEATGFTVSALRTEPKAAAESYARLKAEVNGSEVRIQTMRGYLSENAPEFRQAQATLAALREQLARAEKATDSGGNSDYVGKYREFKYQEALFDLFARQYELARADESREGALIQIVDAAVVPERKAKPRRIMIALAAGVGAFVLLATALIAGAIWRSAKSEPGNAAHIERIAGAWSFKRGR